jgi:hypothetical protein
MLPCLTQATLSAHQDKRTPTLLRAVDSSTSSTLLLVIPLVLSQCCQPSTRIAAAPVHQLLLHTTRALLHQPLLLLTAHTVSIRALPAPAATPALLLQQARAGGCYGVRWQLGHTTDHKVRCLRTIIVSSQGSPPAPCCCCCLLSALVLRLLLGLLLLLLVLRGGALCTAARLLLLLLLAVSSAAVGRFPAIFCQAEVVCCFDQHQND